MYHQISQTNHAGDLGFARRELAISFLNKKSNELRGIRVTLPLKEFKHLKYYSAGSLGTGETQKQKNSPFL